MKGQSLVEFAVSMVFVLILLSGAVETGIALFQYIQLYDAAQEGALFGSICQDEAKIEQRVRSSSSSPLDLNDESVIIDVSPGENDGIAVTLSYKHRVFMPFASVFAGEYINLNASVVDTILTRNNCG